MTRIIIDPEILGQLLLLQSSLQVAPDVKGLGEQVCYVFKKIQGVAAIGLYLENELITQSIVNSDSFTLFPPTWEQVNSLSGKENQPQGEFHKVSIQTSEKAFGYFIFLTDNQQPFSTYLPYIENTINMVALILENRHQGNELRREKNFLQAVLDNVQDGIVACNQEGMLTLFNRASRSIHGLPEQPIPPDQWANHYDLFHVDGLGRMDQKDIPLFRALNGGYVKDQEMVIAPQNQDQRTLVTAAQPLIDSEHNVLGAVAIMHDITDQKIAEDALRRSYDELEDKIQERTLELQQSNDRLEKEIAERKEIEEQLRQAHKMEAIGTLAGGIAHDFNNILSAVIGFTELALDAVEKETPIEGDLQEVYTAGLRAKDLVKQILTFARQSDEKLKPIQVDFIIKEVLKFIRSSTPTTIEFKQNIVSDSLIIGSSSQIHRIMMNLCTNAAHAMENKGGILEVTLKDIAIDNATLRGGWYLKVGNYIKIKVADTGDGIDPQIIDKIYEPYFSTKGPGEGTGMGLAMVHGIVETYGGKISVESTLGKGTTFTIYLPVVKRGKVYRQYKAKKIPTGQERILFVDDEPQIAKFCSRMLVQLGYSVTTKTSSVEALELFRSKPDDYDLIISDVTMPQMTGDQLATELLQIRQDLPVILCTGYSKRFSEEKSSEIGVKAFAYKPIVKEDLAKTVREVLDLVKD